MTNAFSPNYKPMLDTTGMLRDAREKKISETRSRQRAEGMASDDPEVRKKAAGTVGNGKLSKSVARKSAP